MSTEFNINDLSKYSSLKVYHNDCEYGYTSAVFRLEKLVDVVKWIRGNKIEMNYRFGFDESAIERMRKSVTEFGARDLEKEYSDHRIAGMSLEDYVRLWNDEQLTNLELLKRIEEAEYSVVICGT